MSHPANPSTTVITDARPGASADKARRQRNYLIAMTFRVVCFLGMLVVSGWLRWVMLAVAIVTPIIAVMVANNVDRREPTPRPVERGEPEPHPQLTARTEDPARPEEDDQ